jgi:hypothetical protein
VSDTLLLWLLGGAFAMNAVQFKLWWDHARECRDYRSRIATMEADLKTVVHEIGDHETGIRGSVHQLIKQISPMYIDWQRKQRL